MSVIFMGNENSNEIMFSQNPIYIYLIEIYLENFLTKSTK